MTKLKQSKTKAVRLSKIEKAIWCLAKWMENPMHDQYQIVNEVLDILGYTPLTNKNK